MKILLAAGVFFPDIGGPATHVKRIAEGLHASGVSVSVLAYGDYNEPNAFPFPVYRISRKHSGLVRWTLYFFKALKLSASANTIYAFDPTAAGLPAYLAARIRGKRFIIRTGGDPIWERVVEHGKRFMPLDDYYKKGLAKKDKPLLFFFIQMVLRGADTVVAYNDVLKNFYTTYFGVKPERIVIIKNPVASKREVTSLPVPPTFMFAGRFVAYKNLPLVMRAFNSAWLAHKTGKLLLVGAGPDEKSLREFARSLAASSAISFESTLPQEELFMRIASATVCLAPALSEFSPNFILEGLSFGKPALISRGNGLTVSLPDEWLFDPMNEKELAGKMERYYDPSCVTEAAKKVAAIPLSVTWEDVLQEQYKVLNIHQ